MKLEEVNDILTDYSEYSTIQGLVYIFQTKQSHAGRIFWTLIVTSMLFLAIYWSVTAYSDWQNSPVLTTLTTTGFPIKDIEFPAFTVCGQVTIQFRGCGFESCLIQNTR